MTTDCVLCTKIEEYGDSEYRRMLGRPYDYSAARMQELRREASRYREAHVGRARDSWVTLSRAVRNRRRRDLKLLALPMDQLSARLPPSRPTKTSIAAEVAALNSFADSSSAAGETNLIVNKFNYFHLIQKNKLVECDFSRLHLTTDWKIVWNLSDMSKGWFHFLYE